MEFFKKLYIFVHASGLKSNVRRMDLLIKRTARVSESGVPKKRVLCTDISVDDVWLGMPLEAANESNGRSAGYPPLLLKLRHFLVVEDRGKAIPSFSVWTLRRIR